ncbi:MAG: response regulator [bacterium]
MANKILLVDDDKLLVKTWGDKFRNSGFDVFIAYNGEQGMEVAFREHPDLILLDILMPKVDGMEALKKIRKDKWGKKRT